MIQIRNGWYAATGYTYSFKGGIQVYLVILDNQGNFLYQHAYGGSTYDAGHSIQQTPDGGLVIAGYLGNENYVLNVGLIKTDSTGNLVFMRVYGGSSDNRGNYIKVLDDGSFIIAGETSSYGAG